jgi:serine/threonine protein phosphatase PrpC
MIICPACHTENRIGATFCKKCATRLPASSAATRPLGIDESGRQLDAVSPPPQTNTQTTRRPAQVLRTGTRSLQDGQNYVRRPHGAIFGDNYLYEAVLFSDEQQHRYQVHQLDVAEEFRIHVCPNPSCGAVFPPRTVAMEKYCTDCGTELEAGGKNLIVIEAISPIPENIVRAAAKGLSHGSVRAPLAAFVERLAGQPRHCVVVTQVIALQDAPDTLQALKWGTLLARGLEYLHDNGVGFAGQVEPACIGLADGHPVWANFTNCVHHPDGYIFDRKDDTAALALLVFQWLTSKNQFERDPNLTPAVNRAFEPFYSGAGVEDGGELAARLERALQETAAPEDVDFRLGRRTHVGMVRNLNEDSLLTLELNRTQQSVSQPLGIFIIADGMGGHAAGEIASGTIVNSIAKKAAQELFYCQLSLTGAGDCQKWLRDAVEAANSDVYALRKSSGTDMGSTLVAAVLDGNMAYIAHVGDSRAYRINPQGIQRLTLDHSLVERLIATHQISREEARFHPQRNVIYRTIGDKSKIEVDVSTNLLDPGDYLLLCSDGLSGMLDDQTILNKVLEAPEPQAACDTLVAAANAAGGDDNISVVIVQVVQP